MRVETTRATTGDLGLFSSYEGYEVLGQSIKGFLQGFRGFQILAAGYLRQEGIGTPGPDDTVVIDPEAWYPLAGYLRAFSRIAKETGDALVTELGITVMQHVHWPEAAKKSLEGMVAFIDAGYHLHHRRFGEVMFDPKTGSMLEGIGHYRGVKTPGAFIIECETPYPCQFDVGLIKGGLKRLGVSATVEHEKGKPCRRHGGHRCTLRINVGH